MKIAILGAGAFGTALGGILTEKGHDVLYYDKEAGVDNLRRAINEAEYIVLAVPSNAVPDILPFLPKNKPLIIATKGLLGDKIFREFGDVMAISGPGFADDIKAHKSTLLTATDKRVSQLFETDYLKIELTRDLQGILLLGALKNVYAIYAGYLGLKPHTAAWQDYITDVSEELQALISANGGEAETVNLACGVGDLKLTAGKGSRNYEFGTILRENSAAAPTKTVEGLNTLAKIKQGEIIVPDSARILEKILEELWA
ncbi:hypothetical protein IKG68_00920 [Candidatus Saccharibacteria bacterium]|nr:hypothetical protein [Candidatus Saccharibacteria bacterium]